MVRIFTYIKRYVFRNINIVVNLNSKQVFIQFYIQQMIFIDLLANQYNDKFYQL